MDLSDINANISNKLLYIILGSSIFCASFIFLVLYIPIMFIFLTDKEYMRSKAYIIMTCIAVTDILQLFIHMYSGILVLVNNSRIDMTFNKIMGALLSGLWYCMLMLTSFLNINRLCDIIFFKYSGSKIITYIHTMFYIACILSFISPTVLKLLPKNNYIFIARQFFWGPLSTDDDISFIMRACGRYLVLVVVFSSVITYTLIVAHILFMTHSKLTARERKITIQVILIILYFLFSYVYWNYMHAWFPKHFIFEYISLMVWVFMNGIHPIIYLIFNKRLRHSYGLLVKSFMKLKISSDSRKWNTTPTRSHNTSTY